MVAGVHGDEVAPIGALEDWLDTTTLAAGSVLAIPIAHPAALRAGTRLGDDELDLNRTFPGDASGAPTRALARWLSDTLFERCDALVTLHSWSRSGATIPYVEVPAHGEASVVAASRRLGAALNVGWLEPYDWDPGLLPAAAVAAGTPAVELEVGGLGSVTAADEQTVRSALDGVAASLGLLHDARRPDGDPEPPRTRVARRHWLTAPAPGRARVRRPLGDELRRGDLVAEVIDDEARQPVLAPTSGTLAIIVTHGWVAAGAPVAVVFEDTGEQVAAA